MSSASTTSPAMAGPAPNVIALSEVQPERVRWLSPGRLAAGKLTILDGDPGLGKSTLLCDWAAAISRGDALPGGWADRPRGVVFLTAEDGLADTLRPRCDAAGADPARIFALRSVPDGTPEGRLPAIPGDLDAIETVVTRYDVALVVVDPLVAYIDGGLNAYRDQDVRRALAPLASMAERTGAAVLAIRHLNKLTQGSALYRGGGSIGIIGAARCGLVLAADPDDPTVRVLAPTKSNLALHPPALAFRLVTVEGTDVARVEWIGETTRRADDLLQPSDSRQHPELNEAKAWLEQTLSSGPVAARQVEELAKRAGFSGRTLRRARESLEIDHERRRVGAGHLSYWSLRKADRGPSEQLGQPPLYGQVGHVGQVGRVGQVGHVGHVANREIPRNREKYQDSQEQHGQLGQLVHDKEVAKLDRQPVSSDPGAPERLPPESNRDLTGPPPEPAAAAPSAKPALSLILGGKHPRMQGTPPGVPLPIQNPDLPPSMNIAPWETKEAHEYFERLLRQCVGCGNPLPDGRHQRCYECLPKDDRPPTVTQATFEQPDDDLTFLDNELWNCVGCGQPLPGDRRYHCYDCFPEAL